MEVEIRYYKIFRHPVRMLLYNSLKINRECLEKYQKKVNKSPQWTLQDNKDALEELFLEA